ncbi:hypothetical protein PM10SUCC1_08000 [Propionigenium maris DSM 9537]|uniref:Uncharacterized protein n=1 Tax=Propionigenium maris DSM 9537 TaxID=1123000 RepID=A0A9W6GK42_9FUSO|nr:hypothetical protein [Propionigenium maris]GLI55286.1 hypothetical protein PM10SUCC1_08000 [Propionigenium maris DSM 9537]
MYFVQYIYEVIGDYSVSEEVGTIMLEDISGGMEKVISEVAERTNHSVLSIREILPLKAG